MVKIIINKRYIMFICFLYFFVFKDFLEQMVPALGYSDELISIIAIPIVILSKGRILKASCFQYRYFIYTFILIGILSSLKYRYQPFFACALPDLFLNIKFWLSIVVGYYFFCELPIKRYANKIFFHVKLIICLYVILILLDYLTDCFDSPVRYGLKSIQLFYTHPTVFSACCVLLLGILFSVRDYVYGSNKYFALILVLMCTTLRAKAFGAALMFAVFYYIVYWRKEKVRLSTLLLFAPAVIAIAWNQIEYYFFSSIQDDSARYQLLVKAIQIADEHFPLGAGFGSYGSYFSTIYYSPLYYIYNLYGVHGLGEESANFVSDNYWPMILGETGWPGLLVTMGAIISLFLSIQNIRKINISYNFAAICILVYLLIISTAEAALVHSLAIPMAIWLGCLLAQRDNDIK